MRKNFTEEQIILICEGLANGDTARQISDRIGVEHTPYFETYMSRIRHRELWNDITQDYDFEETARVKQIRKICEYIVQGHDNYEICGFLGDRYDKKLYRLVRRIRSGECHRKISIQYGIVDSLKPDTERVKKKKERIHKICKCLEKGMSSKEIAKELNEEYTNSLRTLISSVRSRRIHTDISCMYRFKMLKKVHSRKEVIKVCECIDKGMTAREIAKKLRVAHTESFISFVSKIRTGAIKQEVSKNYNFYKEKIRA